jgi:hypothetical protein
MGNEWWDCDAVVPPYFLRQKATVAPPLGVGGSSRLCPTFFFATRAFRMCVGLFLNHRLA